MKSLFWFVLGIAGGFVAAHLVNKDPRGHEVLAEVDARIAEFTDRMGDAYRAQESRFTELVDGVKDTASEVAAGVKDTASDVAAGVKDTATDVADAAKKLAD